MSTRRRTQKRISYVREVSRNSEKVIRHLRRALAVSSCDNQVSAMRHITPRGGS